MPKVVTPLQATNRLTKLIHCQQTMIWPADNILCEVQSDEDKADSKVVAAVAYQVYACKGLLGTHKLPCWHAAAYHGWSL